MQPVNSMLGIKTLEQINFNDFKNGWNSKTIRIAAQDGYAYKILFEIINDRYSSTGWALANWFHRLIGLSSIILSLIYSWCWLLLIIFAFTIRRAYYEEIRKEIGKICSESEEKFFIVKASGVVKFLNKLKHV